LAGTAFANPLLLKTGPEVFASYSAITSIGTSDPDLLTTYHQDKHRLPQTGAASEMNSNVVLALTELGGQFCAKAIARETAKPASQRNLFASVDFTKGPNQFADDYNAGLVIDQLSQAFWSRSPTSDEKTLLLKSMRAALNGVAGTTADTQNVAQLTCTLFASSINFLVK